MHNYPFSAWPIVGDALPLDFPRCVRIGAGGGFAAEACSDVCLIDAADEGLEEALLVGLGVRLSKIPRMPASAVCDSTSMGNSFLPGKPTKGTEAVATRS